MAEGPAPRESAPSKGRLNVKRSAFHSPLLDALDQGYSREQLQELEKHFQMEPHPDLEAQRVLAARLNLTEEQVKIWFTQRSLKQKMCLCSAWLLWKPVRRNPYPCASNKAGGCRPPSCWCRLIPINSSGRFSLNFQRYMTHRRQLRQGVYKTQESSWCGMTVPRTVKPHVSSASRQGKESSQNSPGLSEALEALKKLRLSSGHQNTDDC